jgi:hypothetical protein
MFSLTDSTDRRTLAQWGSRNEKAKPFLSFPGANARANPNVKTLQTEQKKYLPGTRRHAGKYILNSDEDIDAGNGTSCTTDRVFLPTALDLCRIDKYTMQLLLQSFHPLFLLYCFLFKQAIEGDLQKEKKIAKHVVGKTRGGDETAGKMSFPETCNMATAPRLPTMLRSFLCRGCWDRLWRVRSARSSPVPVMHQRFSMAHQAD